MSEVMTDIKINSRIIESWLEDRKWSQKKLASVLGYNDSLISRVLSGNQEPTKQMMKKLMKLTGLGFRLFIDPVEQGFSLAKSK